MSTSQWKLVTYLREYLPKPSSDKNSIMLTLNKEWTNIFKKASSVTNSFPLMPVESRQESNSKVTPAPPAKPPDPKEMNNFLSNSISELPLKINDLKMKFSQKSDIIEEEKSKWKTKKNIVSDLSIHARTKYIISSILNAESENSRVQRLESLVEHFLQYPDGVQIAVKEGAIAKLITLRERNKNEKIAEVVREALTILGYTEPPMKQGIRILSIDGGGIRGLMVMEMLKKLEELTGTRICEMFDYICGVSTGSVIACTVGATGKSISDLSDLYRDLSTKIFTQNAFFGARSLIWNHGYYDTALWESILKEHVGMTQLIKTTRRKGCPKVS